MNRRMILSGLLAGAMANTVLAQEVQTATDKAQTFVKILQNEINGRTTEKATFLGIASTPVSAAMREQLKLKKGVGLVVERVEKDSPADQAGVKQYDIVEKMDDQWLINADQFAALVKMQEPGKQVSLSIIRQGQPQSINVTLVEKPVQMAKVNAISILGDPNGKVLVDVPRVSNLTIGKSFDAFTRTPKDMTMTSAVGQNIITIKKDGDNTHLTANDLNGEQIFDGDVNTEEQWKDVPPDIAKEAQRLISMLGRNGLQPAVKTVLPIPPLPVPQAAEPRRKSTVPAQPQAVQP